MTTLVAKMLNSILFTRLSQKTKQKKTTKKTVHGLSRCIQQLCGGSARMGFPFWGFSFGIEP
jgi:hypothetical protein